ncbi:hypothetical protein [Streptomyces sp. NPDC048277]|uniref:hypothetical protein n=1 Tax=Streptomyces sp. NPDC048277 TaxID=3155027 RepID=UPI0033CE07D7
MWQAKARAAVTFALAASLPLISGCTTHNDQAAAPEKHPRASAAPSNSPSSSPSTSPSGIDPPKSPPDITDSTKALVRLADRTGSEEVAAIATIKAGTVAVATDCTGEGRTVIAIGKSATYTIPCEATPSSTYNEIRLSSSERNVTITVTADTGIHWGLSVGWRPRA